VLIATNQVLRSDKKPSVSVDSMKSEIARAFVVAAWRGSMTERSVSIDDVVTQSAVKLRRCTATRETT